MPGEILQTMSAELTDHGPTLEGQCPNCGKKATFHVVEKSGAGFLRRTLGLGKRWLFACIACRYAFDADQGDADALAAHRVCMEEFTRKLTTHDDFMDALRQCGLPQIEALLLPPEDCVCENCGEGIPGHFEACWNCGTEFDMPEGERLSEEMPRVTAATSMQVDPITGRPLNPASIVEEMEDSPASACTR